MAVVDLDDVELLDDARVELHLVVLESGSNLASKVHSNKVVKLLLTYQIALIHLKVALDLVNITSVFEQSVDRLLAGLNVLDIGLALNDLLLDRLNVVSDSFELI